MHCRNGGFEESSTLKRVGVGRPGNEGSSDVEEGDDVEAMHEVGLMDG